MSTEEIKLAEDNRIIKINMDLTETNIHKNETTNTNQIFWTTDKNSAYLEFTTSQDLAYATGSLVLKNTSDGSVIQRNLEMNYSPFYYKLKEEEIERAGNWIGQIVIEKDGKSLTDRSFKFNIKGSLLDSVEPALSDIENYNKFYTQLADLEAEMNDYLEVANSKELERELAETERLLAEENRILEYDNRLNSAIVEADVVEKVDNKVAELTPTIQQVTTQLAQKLTKGVGSVTPADLSQETKEQMTGGSVAVVGDYAVLTRNIVDNQITVPKTEFLKTSTNLLNLKKVSEGYNLSSQGQLAADVRFSVTEFIPVKPQDQISSYRVAKVCWYDKNKVFISITSSITTITAPSNTAYMRGVTEPIHYATAQINKSASLLPYESHYITFGEKENFISPSTPPTSTALNFGLLTGSASYINFDWINSVLTIVGNTSRIMYSGVNKVVGQQSVALPAENRHRLLYNPVSDTVSIVLWNVDIPAGSVMFGIIDATNDLVFLIPEYSVNGKPVSYMTGRIEAIDKLVVEGINRGTYSAPSMPDMSAILPTMTADEMLTLYDNEILSIFPDYVTKKTLGLYTSGKPMPCYEFKLTDVPNTSTKTIKMIILSGIHGSEKAGVYALFQAMKQICEAWQTSDLLETLRWNIHFIIVPIVNDYGFTNYTRKNQNGVDLARNFPERWAYRDEPDAFTYQGTAPLSELESQHIAKLLKENTDAIYFGSIHNFTTPAGPNYFIWNAAATSLQINLGKKLVSKMSRKWKRDYDYLPKDNSTYYGYADLGSPFGSEGKYAASLGIQGGSFEICEKFTAEPGSVSFNNTTFEMGVETLINWFVINLRENVEFYNNR